MTKIKVARFREDNSESSIPTSYMDLVEIDDSLESLQNEVGGYIEYVQISNTLAFIVNEEFLYKCQPNRAIYADSKMIEDGFYSQINFEKMYKSGDLFCVFFGNFIAVGQEYDAEEGYKTVSISDDDIKRLYGLVGSQGSALLEMVKIKYGI